MVAALRSSRAIDDQRAGLIQVAFCNHAFVEVAVYHVMSLFHEMTRIGFIFIDDHGGDIGLFEFGHQRCDRRAVVENDHMILRVGGILG